VAGIDAVRLQDLRKLAVRQPHDETDAIYLLAGPDAEGWVAFVTDNMEAKTHSLKVIKMDGTGEEEVFTAPGDALWDNPMSTPALAPRGGSVAFLTQPVRSFAPRIESGPIEVWNIHTKKEQDTNIEALNRGLSWFPDGKHFTYVQVQPGEPEMVYILNVENGERKLLHTGRNAMVSTDGESVLVNTAEEGI
jgi:Tol biopolymer transport system component